jgi:predicted glycoside hydrolase/deacetylase ChbG (UPF0249 family)
MASNTRRRQGDERLTRYSVRQGDNDGCFWRDVASLRRHLVPEAAEAELRTQIERARLAGINPTHIDAHMAAAMLPKLLDCRA